MNTSPMDARTRFRTLPLARRRARHLWRLVILGAVLLPFSVARGEARNAASDSSEGSSLLWHYAHDGLVVSPLPEAVATTGLGLAWALVLDDLTPRVTGTEAEPAGLDAWGHPSWNPTAQAASDYLAIPTHAWGLNVPVFLTVGVATWGGLAAHDVGYGLSSGLVIVESVVLTAATTSVIKAAVARPRPYTSSAFQQTFPEAYAGTEVQENLGEEGEYDAWRSFPSGHTSAAAAVGISAAALVWYRERRGSHRAWVGVAAYGAGAALGATTGFLRVYGGKHHPSDTVAGFALGTGLGLLVPWLHTRGQENAVQLHAGPDGVALGGTW